MCLFEQTSKLFDLAMIFRQHNICLYTSLYKWFVLQLTNDFFLIFSLFMFFEGNSAVASEWTETASEDEVMSETTVPVKKESVCLFHYGDQPVKRKCALDAAKFEIKAYIYWWAISSISCEYQPSSMVKIGCLQIPYVVQACNRYPCCAKHKCPQWANILHRWWCYQQKEK